MFDIFCDEGVMYWVVKNLGGVKYSGWVGEVIMWLIGKEWYIVVDFCGIGGDCSIGVKKDMGWEEDVWFCGVIGKVG